MQLGELLQLGRGEELTGGRRRAGNLTDMVEALIGAVWLDGGLEAARDVFHRLVDPLLEDEDFADEWDQNPKGKLQELAQKRWNCQPVYQVEERKGEDHDPSFRVRVIIAADVPLQAEGEGGGKRAAEVAAARKLLQMLKEHR
jgi:ribonuclease-3